MSLTAEQWEQWRANPATEWFFRFLQGEIERTKMCALMAAWDHPLSEAEHASYRERGDTLSWLGTLNHEITLEILEDQEKAEDEWRKTMLPGKKIQE